MATDYVAKYRELHIEDPDLYNLDQLQFLEDNSVAGQTKLKTVGKGGFGSILLAHLPKRIDTRIKPHQLVSKAKQVELFLHDLKYYNKEVLSTPTTFVEVIDPKKQESQTLVLVAVKRLTDYAPELMESLIREASRLRNLWGSRNVVTVHGVVQNKELDSPCIVMDIVHGSSLNAFLRSYSTSSEEFVNAGCSETDRHNRLIWTQDQTLWWKKKLEIFRELTFALMLCHKEGIFHGDLKGENVLLDEFLIPKLADFGLSFVRRKDWSYFKSFGGSLFWVSPEIYDADSPPKEVLNDPYPSDVYSLGMILVEMFVEGQIPSEYGDSFIMDKLQGGSPIPLHVPPNSQISSSFFRTQILGRINDLVERCCSADRKDRCSLEECLAAVEEMYSLICNSCSSSQRLPQSPIEVEDAFFIRNSRFDENLTKFKSRFPDVPECVVLQPSKNMILDSDGYRLIHYFCKLDFMEGVKYIVEKASWDFHPSGDVLEMAYSCVEESSLSVLKFLGRNWKDIVGEEINLVHEACNHDSSEILRFLVFDLNMDFDSYYESVQVKPIHKLAFTGKNDMIQVLLEKSVNMSDYVNTVCSRRGRPCSDKTPLHYAVEGDQARTVEFLLKKRGTVNNSWSLSSLACNYGSIEVTKKLLELGYSFDKERFDFHHPLHEICVNGHEKLLDLLKGHIKNKEHIDGHPNRNIPYPPLHYLCVTGKTKMAEVLISEMGANVKFVDKEGNTFLHGVSKRGYKETAELLLCHGVDLNLENKDGQTALDFAVQMGHTELQNLLLQVGGIRGKGFKQIRQVQQIDRKQESQVCQLTKAVQDGNLEEVKQILAKESLKSKYSSEAQSDLVKTCCEKGYLDILRILHEHGVDIHGKVAPSGGKSPLHWAARYGNVGIIKFLIEKGVEVNVPHGYKVSTISPMVNSSYSEALHFAADKQHVEAMEALLQAGADANAVDYHNTTAMDRAIGFENKRMIELLIKYQFDTGRRDRDDRTYMSRIADIY
ncbi:hypothetical protein O6H91_06G111300 [Diphasiastrum complanatum]|uniref:Uncharacterized protein n=2 Tax=Diphasiastrum complanatum TaxID=34168 RepID=A0ACC2DHG7_DIPCM|nr:hypothetical protein O6H91_06G111300 [Diphasiastrum complanatum]